MTTSKKARCFFSDTVLAGVGQVVYLQPEETRHIQLTLRLQPGSEVRVTDGLGHEAAAVISAFEADHRTRLTLKTMLQSPADGSGFKAAFRLFAAFAAKGVMDELVEKGQELGVSAFYPLVTERTVVSLAEEKEGKVLERWYKITRESAKQSGNAALMQIAKPITMDAALKLIPPGEEILFFHPDETGQTLAEWLRNLPSNASLKQSFNLFIGPEGGFSDREILKAQEAAQLLGLRVSKISLGRAILRVSTAVVAAISAIKFSQ